MQHSPGFVKLVEATKAKIKEWTWQEMFAQQKKTPIVLIDVREDHEWDKGHAADAIHLGKGIIERDIEKIIPNKDAILALYCGGGSRSALAAFNLNQMGYEKVYSIKGGFREYEALQ